MKSFRKAQIELLTIFAGVALMSCAPTRTQTTAEGPKHACSAGHMDAERKPLSTTEILEVANVVARERGWPLTELRGFLDKDNAHWKSRGMSKVYIPELEGHDFQVVIYRRRQIMIAEDCVVVVDKNTGEVLLVLE